MEVSFLDSILQLISGLLSIETLESFAPLVAVSAAISAFTSSKAEHKNPIIRIVLQTFKDIVNILAFNIYKAKNVDDVG